MANTVTIVQARQSSTRLPGKIFLPLVGEPLLVRMVERVASAEQVGTVVIATTTNRVDDETAALCEKYGLHCYRGDPDDLLDRHYRCALEFGADVVLKIPSDCPLIDPNVIDRVIRHFDENQADFVSNLHPATYPDGNDVEVMNFETLETAWKEAGKDFEREHTTPFIWERPDRFHLLNVECESGRDLSMSHRWSIDYREDYEFIQEIFKHLFRDNPSFGLDDILSLLDSKPELTEINSKYLGVNWYRHHIDELQTIPADRTKQI